MTDDDRRMIAEQIARDLFTNGFGERAATLVLIDDAIPPSNLGGWSEEAMADRIEEALIEFDKRPGSSAA